MATLRYNRLMLLLWAFTTCASLLPTAGCGSTRMLPASAIAAESSSTTPPGVSLGAVTAVIPVGSKTHLTVTPSGTGADLSKCTWTSANPAVLSAASDGTLTGTSVGSTSVTVNCSGLTASTTAAVTSPSAPAAIIITSGGTYSGDWSSNDPTIPVVNVETEEPVIIQDSTVTGKGHLIFERSSQENGQPGGQLTLNNVTGIGINPNVSGLVRGMFLHAEYMGQISVSNCTMIGTGFGIYIAGSILTSLEISNNTAQDLDDRISDGNGGYLLNQRMLGHFIQLNSSHLPKGGDISWNQIVNHTGVASIEDIFNFAATQGSAAYPILVHDNYLQGAFATGMTTWYTGGGIQFDGDTDDPTMVTAFYKVYNNEVVHTANFGIAIGTGHDIHVDANRIVSCGQDGNGNWFNFGGSAANIWNYNNITNYFNNSISGTSGGLVALEGGQPVESDFLTPSLSASLNIVLGPNSMDHPCWINGEVSQAAEATEWTAWLNRIDAEGKKLGDQH